MREHPILFSAPMVRAILDGRKTQTRRVCKPQPYIANTAADGMRVWNVTGAVGGRIMLEPDFFARCPYGQPGDRLWVRETFATWPTTDGEDEAIYRATDDEWECRMFDWRPSIFMPRKLSRITLEVTGVRVERLQDMEGKAPYPGESDALAEGVRRIHHGDGEYYFSAFRDEPHPKNWSDPVDAFRELWESINGAGSWDVNPWVWVVEFRRLP